MTGLILPRRKFLVGAAAFLAAPAIVRASSLMPVKAEKIIKAGEYVWVHMDSIYIGPSVDDAWVYDPTRDSWRNINNDGISLVAMPHPPWPNEEESAQ